MVDVTADLQRRDPSLAAVPWVLIADPDQPATDLSDPVIDQGARDRLDDIAAAIAGLVQAGGTVSLSAASLAALESITATVANLPADYPDTAATAILGNILTALGATLTVDGTVDLSAASLAALETITAVVSGTVALDAPTLAALENVVVSGTVAVSNHPADYPLPAGQVTTLTPQTNALTDTQLRATAVLMADANEEAATIYAPVNFNGAGAQTIVVVAPGQRLRLRRFLLTSGDPDADPPANPVLTITLGTKALRTTALIGRFDITGADGEDLVITSSKAGQVDGTVGYLLV